MNEQELFIQANQTLAGVIAQIQDQQMDLLIPAELSWRPNQTVRAAMNIYAYENACVPDVLAGKDKQATNDEFKGDLLGDAPQVSFKRYSDLAIQAARSLDDPDRIVHISYGDFPARQYLRDITIQRGLGAWDTATFIGAPTTFADDLVQGLWEIILPVAEYLRSAGIFRPAVDVPAGAPLQDRLLGLTGRQP